MARARNSLERPDVAKLAVSDVPAQVRLAIRSACRVPTAPDPPVPAMAPDGAHQDLLTGAARHSA